ncbi:MAG TPA: DUF2997 domain-containing protein [Planctomycetaceae bacterium]|nr:DUF2997 domain-containing protein [Planctomycetaceae bacterium]
MPTTIMVTISPTGETQIETHGFTGASCRDATRVLEAALGLRESEQLTSAFYAPTQETTPAHHTQTPT